MGESPVRPFPEIDAIENLAVGPVSAASGVVDMNAEYAGKGSIAFQLIGNRARYPRCLRLALLRGIIVERTIFDGHPELVAFQDERHSRIGVAGRLEDGSLHGRERGRLALAFRSCRVQRRRMKKHGWQDRNRAKLPRDSKVGRSATRRMAGLVGFRVGIAQS